MDICGASADFKKALTEKEFLQKGKLKTLQIGGINRTMGVTYSVLMEDISVVSYSESLPYRH